MLETPDALVVVEPEQIAINAHGAGGWQLLKKVGIGQTTPLARDPRGVILTSADGSSFEAYVAGSRCGGVSQPAGEWAVHCHENDDPWPILPVSYTHLDNPVHESGPRRNLTHA